MQADSALVVFSHLRWNFVYQRPQHLISRLAGKRRVFYVEEPVHDDSTGAHFELEHPQPGLTVCRPHTPLPAHGFDGGQIALVRPMLQELLAKEGISECILWFYTPLALPLGDELPARALVYDCMDELSAFLNAPRQLLEREADLLKKADVVFTGGPSLYRAKKDRHHNVHCFPSSVDADHFGKARMQGATRPAENKLQAPVARPRLGFFGVIDERFDVPLLDYVARARPDWQICLVGPVVKISEESLPQHANIHRFGQQSYADLPSFLAGWDVCLLPFAQNEATRFISPTKTLEYMAAERPIVSTPITDVAEPYGDVVYLANTPAEFVAACERALAALPRKKLSAPPRCALFSPRHHGMRQPGRWRKSLTRSPATKRRRRREVQWYRARARGGSCPATGTWRFLRLTKKLPRQARLRQRPSSSSAPARPA